MSYRYDNDPANAIKVSPIFGTASHRVHLEGTGSIGSVAPPTEPDGEGWAWASYILPYGVGGGKEWSGFHNTKDEAVDQVVEMYQHMKSRGLWRAWKPIVENR